MNWRSRTIGLAAWITVACLCNGSALAEQYSWSGFYIGAEAGGGSGSSDFSFLGQSEKGVFTPNPQPGGPVDPEFSVGLAGGHFGYMHQMGGLVIGVEGTWDGLNADGQTVFDPATTPQGVGTIGIESIALLNGRLGVANDRMLAFATVGLAYGRFNASESGNFNGELFRNAGDANLTGWNAGAGLSYAVTNAIIIGAQYNHADFGTENIELHDDGSFFTLIGTHPQLDVVKGSISLKLGSGW
jgi:outer membrane immunogenic protein